MSPPQKDRVYPAEANKREFGWILNDYDNYDFNDDNENYEDDIDDIDLNELDDNNDVNVPQCYRKVFEWAANSEDPVEKSLYETEVKAIENGTHPQLVNMCVEWSRQFDQPEIGETAEVFEANKASFLTGLKDFVNVKDAQEEATNYFIRENYEHEIHNILSHRPQPQNNNGMFAVVLVC